MTSLIVSGGKLEDIVNTAHLGPRHVLRVFYETCSAVAHMHSQSPPIVHRDLKVTYSTHILTMHEHYEYSTPAN